MWLTLTGTVGIPVHVVWLHRLMNRQKEKKNQYWTDKKTTREKTNSCLVKDNFLYNIMSFCQENYGLILQ